MLKAIRADFLSFVIASLALACGTSTTENQTTPQQPKKSQSPETGAKTETGLNQGQIQQNRVFPVGKAGVLPAAVIVRVPVDARGTELQGAEMRLHRGEDLTSRNGVAPAFASGQEPVAATSELDQDSSTQSWWWRNSWNNWYSYTPYYNYYGSGYWYSNPWNYSWGGYNYYYYPCNYGYW